MSIRVEYLYNPIRPMEIDPEFDGSCPCSDIEGDGFTIKTHCWRTSRDNCDCEFSGIHVDGNIPDYKSIPLAFHVLAHNGWLDHTHWTILINGRAIAEVEVNPYV